MSRAIRQLRGGKQDRQKEQFTQGHRSKKEQGDSRKCRWLLFPAFRCAGIVMAKKPPRERGLEAARTSEIDQTSDRKENGIGGIVH